MARIEQRVGDRIRALRDEKGWFQKDLAKAASLPVRTIGRIERGEVDVRLSTLEKISKALETTLQNLFA